MTLVVLLALQGALGAFDTLYNHEWVERLARRPEARAELGLHALRETTYAVLFGGLAWFAWHGAFAWIIAALLAGEVLVTATDEAVENRTRVLPQNERVLHVILTLNLGALVATYVPLFFDWTQRPTALQGAHHGALSWILTLFALASAAWAVRDALAFLRLRRSP